MARSLVHCAICLDAEQLNELKRLKGDLIGQLYHSLSYTLIEIMIKEPQCQVLDQLLSLCRDSSIVVFLVLYFTSNEVRLLCAFDEVMSLSRWD